ncbi:hypothetical protein [Dickeya zeae]|uniref:hypothetical protein n=1 Tax=Dickeya zeae TaxID=204042 RepID=UPI0039B09C79
MNGVSVPAQAADALRVAADPAIRYGYQCFNQQVMAGMVIVLVPSLGDRLVRRLAYRR